MLHGNHEPVAVAILAKAPGFAKSRLAPVLGVDGAANLQARFIERAIATAQAAAVGPVTLWVTPERHHPVFERASALHGIALAMQPDGDLGARMLAAATPGPAIVIGTDCPALAPEHLRAAAAALHDGMDVAIVPVEDGGYGLIAMRRPEPALFAGIAWSTNSVMAETRYRLARFGLSWREPARVWDVDQPADVERLAREGFADLIE
jgi:uncharacterized protein